MKEDFRGKKVAVIGLGLMGGSFAAKLREIGCFVIGINRTKEIAEEAVKKGMVDSTDPEELRNAEIVIFCTPEAGTISFIRKNGDLLPKDGILTDIQGVKNGYMERIRTILPKGIDFISAHPMCGREGAGIERADGSIFENANYVIIQNPENKEENIEKIRQMAGALGASHVPVVSEEEHDRAIAYTSDLTHVIAASLINSISYDRDTKSFIGGSFKDETRVADNNEHLWTSLFLENREKLLEEIDRFQSSLAALKDGIERKDDESIRKFLKEAAGRRREMMKS